MTTATFTHAGRIAAAETKQDHPGFLGRIVAKIVEARAERANRDLTEQMRSFDDKSLREFGLSDADIRRIRSGALLNNR
jgi:hypothetical protein